MSANSGELRAIFLAAGFATRMYPLTRNQAKPLLEVGGEPLLTRLVRQVAACPEVADGIVVTNHRFHADFVRWRDELPGGLPLELIDDGVMEDDARLGAIGDLDLALRRAPARAVDGYLVVAGDNLFECDLSPFVRRYLDRRVAQLLLRHLPEPVTPRRYNEVVVDDTGRVREFREKPAHHKTGLASIAVYFLPPELPTLTSAYLAQGGNPDAPGYLFEWLVERIPIEGPFFGGRWFDVGALETLEQARQAFG